MEHTCPKCGTPLTKCVAAGAVGKFSAVKSPVRNFTTKESSPLLPFVCPACGYVEWYVETPENFK